jgi:uncharacterized protein (TIGR03067 family)
MKSAILTGILGLLAIAALIGATNSPTSSQKPDSTTLQGKWEGQEVGSATTGPCYLIFAEKRLEFRGANTNEWYKGTFSLREDTSPKQLIATVAECPSPQYVGQVVKAIYRLEGGALTVTGNEPGNPEVPTSFDAPGARQLVFKKKIE